MNNNVLHQEEISLKELILVLWNKKTLIAVIAAIALAVSAFYTFVLAKATYESSAIFTVNMKESVVTPYGLYSIPFITTEEFTSLLTRSETLQKTQAKLVFDITINKLRNSIRPVNIKGNMFKLIVKASSPEKAYDIARIHAQSYLDQVTYTLAGIAVDELYNTFSAQIKKDQKELEANEIDLQNALELLKETDKTITLENAVISQAEYALIHASNGEVSLDKIKGDKIITQELNPSYLVLLERVTNLVVQRDMLQRSIDQASLFQQELLEEKSRLLNDADSDNHLARSFNGLITIISGSEVAQKVSPGYVFNMAIGFVAGIILGIFAAMFKAYWEGQK
ncbi:MAG: hypothetical protein GX670_03885 [Bacteroidales bacterium]|nr:hypothetical protein [Bacteroidales bacterium]